MFIPQKCFEVLGKLGYSFDDDADTTFQKHARRFAGPDGDVWKLPKLHSIQVCGCHPSGKALLMTATQRSIDDIYYKGDKVLIYNRAGTQVYRHEGFASETLYVYLPMYQGPWVFCNDYRQADNVNLAQMDFLEWDL